MVKIFSSPAAQPGPQCLRARSLPGIGRFCLFSVLKMSELRVLNPLPETEKKIENSSKVSHTKACAENNNNNLDKLQIENPTSLVSTLPSNGKVGSNGTETASSEVEYINSENLTDLEDVGTSLSMLLQQLDSKNWVLVCEGLNNVRRLSIFHKEAMLETLGNIMPLVVKSLKCPRSAVCKTAIMASADIFKVYSDHIIDSFDPLLVQLLLKSSQDKLFLCEAAEKALITMTSWVSPNLLLAKLQPYLKHKNPRIRAKASMCFSRSVARLGVEGINDYGIDKLVQIAASLLTDQLPESREAARTLALELQSAYEKSPAPLSIEESEQSEINSWVNFCHDKLSPLNAQAILRVTSVGREGLAADSRTFMLLISIIDDKSKKIFFWHSSIAQLASGWHLNVNGDTRPFGFAIILPKKTDREVFLISVRTKLCPAKVAALGASSLQDTREVKTSETSRERKG
ncbi:hypothetical protein H6P81_008678 [Aristolochia fimbriata]|uniref:TOG domain-containing protein n=1 Tax=Aristolochia fimbriata TaxID=158543 RepID=A0AAV7ENA4_ARIFI|nr:hypothetical protein H6P81_008678 [Aristolochia fimbriata]